MSFKSLQRILFALMLWTFQFSTAGAQPQLGPAAALPQPGNAPGLVLNSEGAYPGFTLFAPLGNQETFLINMTGDVVHKWQSEHPPANSAFLLPNGDLLRSAKVLGKERNTRFGSEGPSGGRVERFSWDGELLWDYIYSDDLQHQHHDIEPLPNGNVLLIAWHYISPAEAVAAGRNPRSVNRQGMFPDKIVEVKQTGAKTGEVVWEWRAWDHLIQDFDPTQANFGEVAAHPELIDVNLAARPRADWLHANSVNYNPQLDQIILSIRTLSELWIIDHSTTKEEAASHSGGRSGKGGDLLYRWGNPANYRAGTAEDQQLFGQHDARWVDESFPGAGNITIFNNGARRPEGEYSTVDEIQPPIQTDGSYEWSPGKSFGPKHPVWSYEAESRGDFYSFFISGAERLPNGNTLVCSGASGEFFEVTPEKKLVWKYQNPFGTEGDPVGGGAARDRRPRGRERPQRRRDPNAEFLRSVLGPPEMNIVFRVERYAPDYPAFKNMGLKLEGSGE